MSIRILSPSIAVNSSDWSIRNFRMDVTMEVGESEYPIDIFNDVAKHCSKLKKQYGDADLTLVLNCHGKTNANGGYGYGLKLGNGGIGRHNASYFSRLAPMVSSIIITACGAAATSRTNSAGEGDGNLMCGSFAQYARATVQASQHKQQQKYGGAVREDPGFIDDWEGTVLTYGPDGSVIDVKRYAT